MNESEIQALIITAEENYAHARDHEHLRAQVTAILVSAAFVLIGLAIDKLEGLILYFVSALAIVIGLLNIRLIKLHTNRFDRHVDIARQAKAKLEGQSAVTNITPSIEKIGSLENTWLLVATLPVIAGITLVLLKL